MATTAQLTEELQRLQSNETSLISEIASLQAAAQDWWGAASQVKIRIGSKKAGDQADKAFKQAKGDSYAAAAKNKQIELEGVRESMKTVRESIAAKDKAAQTLASQGVSASAEDIKAQGLAEAAVKSAELTGAAQAEALKAKAATDAQATQTRQYITYAVIAIVFIIVAIIIFNKMKKIKKK